MYKLWTLKYITYGKKYIAEHYKSFKKTFKLSSNLQLGAELVLSPFTDQNLLLNKIKRPLNRKI